MKDIYKEHLTDQLRLISKAEFVLDQLLSTTTEDHQYSRGFCSTYPTKALDNMRTMRKIIQMGLDYER